MYHNVKDFERIERLIDENKHRYIDNAWKLDRLDSEIQHKFVIRSNGLYKGAIVFDTVEQFKAWIEG